MCFFAYGLILLVTAGRDAELTSRLLFIWQVHAPALSNLVGVELEPDMHYLLTVPPVALLAYILHHLYLFDALREIHGVFAVRVSATGNEVVTSCLCGSHSHFLLVALWTSQNLLSFLLFASHLIVFDDVGAGRTGRTLLPNLTAYLGTIIPLPRLF